MSTHERRARRLLCRRDSLACALCLALAVLHMRCDGNVHNGRTHPDDMAVAVRFRAPHVVAGCTTELDVTAAGLMQGVTYKMLVLVARAGDFVHQHETSITWSRETGAQGAAHTFQHTLPPLSTGPHTLRVTLLDAAADTAEEALLASVVMRADAREGPSSVTTCGQTSDHRVVAGMAGTGQLRCCSKMTSQTKIDNSSNVLCKYDASAMYDAHVNRTIRDVLPWHIEFKAIESRVSYPVTRSILFVRDNGPKYWEVVGFSEQS